MNIAPKLPPKQQPSLVAPGELPNPRRARFALLGMIVGLLLILVWASFARIDQVTRAPAQIITASRTQLIQSVDGGTITQIHVREGDTVQAGQLLVTLEKARASAAVADSLGKVAALEITLARLEAEVYGTPLEFSPELMNYPEYIRNQTSLYNKRKKALFDELTALEGILKLSQQELAINEALEASGDVSRADILRLQRTVADVTSQIVNKRNRYFQDAQAEMTKAQEDLATQIEQLRDRQQVYEQTELRALVDGVVNHIRVNTIGGVLRPGDIVIELLPADDNLLVEAKVSPADIAFIALGQSASVKLDAYDATIFGGMVGEVVYISPDVLTEDTPQGKNTFYRVHIQITDTEFRGPRAQNIQVRSGLTATAEIKARDRTVLSYLTKPIIKTIDRGLGER
jgi:membrane fusion protein, adhesin transport system